MNTQINTLPEAISASKAVTEFLVRFGASLGLSTPAKGVSVQPFDPDAPKGMSEQVMQILTVTGKPLMPKDIVNQHQALGWPAPAGGRQKLYEAVSGSLSYLLNRKQLIEKTRKGYVIKENP